jgi:YebC/PmpR family DNA-binding regulatory protein
MAGHSHWAKIKRAKGASDAKRGQLFSRLAREISMAAKLGGGDPGFNPRLRQAIATAKAESVTNDTIDRAIKKGTGQLDGGTIEEMLYEGYAPGGTALVVEAATDNKNRTAAEIRAIFTKLNGSLAGVGSVMWMFQHRGQILIPKNGVDEDALMMAALEAGADDVVSHDTQVEVLTSIGTLYAVNDALKAAGFVSESAKFVYISTNHNPVNDEPTARKVLTLIDALDEHDDVLNVYANAEIAPEVLAQLG